MPTSMGAASPIEQETEVTANTRQRKPINNPGIDQSRVALRLFGDLLALFIIQSFHQGDHVLIDLTLVTVIIHHIAHHVDAQPTNRSFLD